MEKISSLNTNTTLFEDHHAAKAVEIIAGFVGKSFLEKKILYSAIVYMLNSAEYFL